MTVAGRVLEDHMFITKLISEEKSFEQVLCAIAKRIKKRFDDYDISTIIFWHYSERHTLRPITCSSFIQQSGDPSLSTKRFSPTKDSSGIAIHLGKPIIKSTKKLKTFKLFYNQSSQIIHYRTSLSLPLQLLRGDMGGAMSVYYKSIFKPAKKILQYMKGYTQLAALAYELYDYKSNPRLLNEDMLQLTDHSSLNKEEIFIQLKNAIINNEFTIYYQPYFDTYQRMIGVEALLRWNHPQYGLLTPDTFLDVAESTGLILDIEKWVINQAILDILEVKKQSFRKINLKLSVNISAKQFANISFVHDLKSILINHTFNPTNLTLEITERYLVKSTYKKTMTDIRHLGVNLSIDDFGTSYSTLQYLKDLPIDEIKIDRHFIQDLEENKSSQKIVQMILQLSHQLNLTSVAEGVETADQYELLQKMNCDRMQGFLFSQPLSLQQLMNFI